MDPHSPSKLFATKYCFLILGDEFLFLNHFFIFRFLCYFVILLLLIFTKTMLLQEPSWLLLSFYLINFFFMKITLNFHVPGCSRMFRHVPECSGMFWNVPCSGFYRRPLYSRVRSISLCNLKEVVFTLCKYE